RTPNTSVPAGTTGVLLSPPVWTGSLRLIRSCHSYYTLPSANPLSWFHHVARCLVIRARTQSDRRDCRTVAAAVQCRPDAISRQCSAVFQWLADDVPVSVSGAPQ